VTDPQRIDVATPAVALRALSWGPEGAPIALCLHGFPIHQGRDHVCADQRGVPSVRSIAAFCPPGREAAASAASQLVHHVLPITMAAGPFHVVGGAEAVAGLVTRISRRRRAAMSTPRSANRGAPHSDTTARRFATAVRPRNTPNCTGTDCRRPDCPPFICTARTTAAPRTTRRGLSFLQLDQPDLVARHIVDFAGQAS
jgi:hypothetical protein